MGLTKKDIVERVCDGLGFPRNQSIEIVESLLELMKSTLVSGDDLLVSGFGKFCVRDKHERKGGIQPLEKMQFCRPDGW